MIGWWLVLLNKPKNSIEWNFESFQGRPEYSENLYRMVLSEPTKPMIFTSFHNFCVPFYRPKTGGKLKLSIFQVKHRFFHFIDMSLFVRPSEAPFYRDGVPFYRDLLAQALHSIEMGFHSIPLLGPPRTSIESWRPPFLLNTKGDILIICFNSSMAHHS